MHRGISYMRASHPGGAERRRWMRGRGRMLRGWAEKGQLGWSRSLRQDRGWGGGSERIEGRSGSSRVLRFSLVRA